MPDYSEQHRDLLPIDDEGEFMDNATLLIDANRGIYIGQAFANVYGHFVDDECKELDPWIEENLRILKIGPDHDEYNDAWDGLLDSGLTLTLPVGKQEIQYTLHMDDDLWGIPVHKPE